MPLSVYVHIPYCLQRCRYCDFTTFEWKEILPPATYVRQVIQEIRHRHHLWDQREIATLYFGGGTPSLIAPELIVAICRELANVGFRFRPDAELTIEINPATLTTEKLDVYLAAGINRFSVGAQTFNDALLTMCGRKHSAADTRATLKLLRNHNYSFDLLFALPGQTMANLERDLDEVLQLGPPHLSAYCLTVPESHPMSLGRPPENEQIDMFARIEEKLAGIDLRKYEISNFARPGMESRHNSVYWRDEDYWGLGLSSHSYARRASPHGLRFWNPKSLVEYARQSELKGRDFPGLLPPEQFERLQIHEALTDHCHMYLRTMAGLPADAARTRFPAGIAAHLPPRLAKLAARGLVKLENEHWKLTSEGQLLSNRVFEELTFLSDDLAFPPAIEEGAPTAPNAALTRSVSDSYCAV